MRLIDADAYNAEMRKRQDACREWKDSLNEGTETYARAEQSYVTFIEAKLTMDSTPTIPAIPLDWLRGKYAEAENALYYCKGDARHNAEVMAAVWMVLAMWTKEQEAR